MTGDEAKKEMNRLLFSNLVVMLGSSAMQQLGKQVNPVTGKSEVNLEGARLTIDMLEMLAEKTSGNLDNTEERALQDLLTSLRLNYVETSADHGKSEDAETEPPAPPETPPSEDADTPADPPADSTAPKEPKYHKYYGS